jgi:hypothetical protein
VSTTLFFAPPPLYNAVHSVTKERERERQRQRERERERERESERDFMRKQRE